VVGPFEWTPTVVGHECLLAIASATGDPGNDTTVTNSIPHSRFVPFDNNVGQRNVAPVAGGGGGGALEASFEGRGFVFRNPHDRTVDGKLEAVLPKFLRRRGWGLKFTNPGGDRFTLPARSSRNVAMRLDPGDDFTPGEIPLHLAERAIDIVSYVDGVVVGGMTYDVDPKLESPPKERPSPEDDRGQRCKTSAEELLACLGLPTKCVTRARIHRISVDIDLDDCC